MKRTRRWVILRLRVVKPAGIRDPGERVLMPDIREDFFTQTEAQLAEMRRRYDRDGRRFPAEALLAEWRRLEAAGEVGVAPRHDHGLFKCPSDQYGRLDCTQLID